MDGYKTVPVAVLTRWVPDGARVVEVGAGLGVMTAALARRAALVVSLEPTPRMLAQARARTDGAPHVVLLPAAGGGVACPPTIELTETVEGWNTAPTAPPYDAALRTFTAPLVDVPALARALTADVLVSDCEGGECALLRGLPACVRMVVVEWHPHLVGDAAVDEAKQGLRREGFGRVDGAVGRLEPGGFAEVEVWTR